MPLNLNLFLSPLQDASGKCMATQKHLVKECPEMLAISTWTGQVPRRPTLPPGAKLSQLMALGSRRDPGHVVWMLAKSDAEMKDVLCYVVVDAFGFHQSYSLIIWLVYISYGYMSCGRKCDSRLGKGSRVRFLGRTKYTKALLLDFQKFFSNSM
ncbi:hypothetical protein SFRURICE_001926 [Spodoptera frugiperda]|nr:hypothetical protein SFRURICE_001926 [Spodoptera frugiperda]